MAKKRFLGHPVHAALAHFPIALLITAPVWDLIGMARNEGFWWTIAFWNVVLGVAIGLIAAYTGFMDFMALGKNHPAGRYAKSHMLCMLPGLALFGTALAFVPLPVEGSDTRSIPVLVLHLCGALILGLGGLLGARLVFRHGVGSESDAARPSAVGDTTT